MGTKDKFACCAQIRRTGTLRIAHQPLCASWYKKKVENQKLQICPTGGVARTPRFARAPKDPATCRVSWSRAGASQGRSLASVVLGTLSTAIRSGLPASRQAAHLPGMGTKSRESIYGGSVRAAAERAAEARKKADRLACEAWNKRMLAFKGPAQPSPTLGDAVNAGYLYLEVRCLGCDTNQTVALDIVRRPKSTPVHELERYMRCKECSQVRGYPYKRSHLVALRRTKISANDPPSTWWPGER